jgi:hypothetical protein
MPELLHVNAAVQCFHGAPATRLSGNPRVRVSGQQVWTTSSTLNVMACPFTIPPKPQPCVTVDWITGATRVKAGGEAVVLRTSASLCKSAEQIPQGKSSALGSQSRAKGA